MSQILILWVLALVLFLQVQCGALVLSFTQIAATSTQLPGSDQPLDDFGEVAQDGNVTYFNASGINESGDVYSSTDGLL